MNWIKRHKFWASVIILILLSFVLSAILNNYEMAYRLGQLIGIYIVAGLIVKIILHFINKGKVT